MSSTSSDSSASFSPAASESTQFGALNALLQCPFFQAAGSFSPQTAVDLLPECNEASLEHVWHGFDDLPNLLPSTCVNLDQNASYFLPDLDQDPFIEPAVSDGYSSRSVSLAPSTGLCSKDPLSSSQAAPWAWGDPHDSESGMYVCPQCPKSFQRVFELEEHAKRSTHKPFLCHQCDQTFSRRDAWTRHKQLHQSRGRFPCPRCDKYSGKNAFKRRDHLKKHLMTVHQDTDYPRLCPFSSCRLSSPHESFEQFDRRKDYTRHMREDHGRETYDCNMGDCRRVGSRGFARKHDLLKHLAKEHRATDDENAVKIRLQQQ